MKIIQKYINLSINIYSKMALKLQITENKSPKYKLNKEDLSKISKGFLISISGAIIDFISQVVFQIDFGEMTPVVYVLTPVLVNTIRKFIADNSS